MGRCRGPGKTLTPLLERVVATYAPRVQLVKLDVDKNQTLASQFRNESIPTDLPSVPLVLMTARRSLPAGAERLLEGLDGLHFVDDEASIEALTARLDAVARRTAR